MSAGTGWLVDRNFATTKLCVAPPIPSTFLAICVIDIERLARMSWIRTSADDRRVELFARVNGERLPRRPGKTIRRRGVVKIAAVVEPLRADHHVLPRVVVVGNTEPGICCIIRFERRSSTAERRFVP